MKPSSLIKRMLVMLASVAVFLLAIGSAFVAWGRHRGAPITPRG